MNPSWRARFWRWLLRRSFKSKRMSVAEYRAFLLDSARRNNRLPAGVKITRLEADGLSAAWALPEDASPGKAALYFHGGGYALGGIETSRQAAACMAQTWRRGVFFPQYRLAPENPFPAALEDALRSYRWLRAQGYASKDIVFCGDSAGGGLSLAAALALRDSGEPLPAAMICFSPWADLTCSGESHARNEKTEAVLRGDVLREWAVAYCGESDPASPLISPLFADFRGFPPLFIQADEGEILLDDSLLLAQKAQAAGVKVETRIWRGLWHAWQTMGSLIPESGRALQEAAEFIAFCERSL